jgi:predicted amidohydrolase YtcJ
MILFYNGIVDSTGTHATALAVEGQYIVAIGSDAEIENLETPGCKKINLNGKTLWPGLTDSHLHFEMYSQSLAQVKCETDSIEACLELVSKKASTTPQGTWIIGQGWNQNSWKGGFGTAAQLDSVSGDHPVYLADKSIHAAWVNTKALHLATIAPPGGGEIQRDEKGAPTGILFENAVSLVEKIIPTPNENHLIALMKEGQDTLHRMGLTGIHDFDRASCFSALQKMHAVGELTLRVTKNLPVEDLDAAIAVGLRSNFGDDHLHIGSVKLFADGALGPQTAAMLSPYENNPANRGTLLLTADEIFEIGNKATSHGFPLAIHAIGDLATHEVLNGLAMVRQYEISNQLPQLLHRIEHLQLLHSDDLLRVKELGIIASMQPIHTTSDMFTADKHWGKRARYAYAFSTLLASGTTMIFGSDAPVESPNPFWGIHASVTRKNHNGQPSEMGWYPQERITIHQAKTAYSETPAFVCGRNHQFGQLRVGLLADLIVLPTDPELITPEELFKVTPESVMIDGKWVFQQG